MSEAARAVRPLPPPRRPRVPRPEPRTRRVDNAETLALLADRQAVLADDDLVADDVSEEDLVASEPEEIELVDASLPLRLSERPTLPATRRVEAAEIAALALEPAASVAHEESGVRPIVVVPKRHRSYFVAGAFVAAAAAMMSLVAISSPSDSPNFDVTFARLSRTAADAPVAAPRTETVTMKVEPAPTATTKSKTTTPAPSPTAAANVSIERAPAAPPPVRPPSEVF